jgi:serine O-acetyltransferase
MLLYHYECKYGIRIAVKTKIGSGLYIGNYSGIFVNTDVVIGKNFNISMGVGIGEANRGPRKGAAVIGDNVYIGPGARIVGKVKIGNNVAIGANCVVTRDIPDNAVVVGVPGKAISFNGSGDYIQYTDY